MTKKRRKGFLRWVFYTKVMCSSSGGGGGITESVLVKRRSGWDGTRIRWAGRLDGKDGSNQSAGEGERERQRPSPRNMCSSSERTGGENLMLTKHREGKLVDRAKGGPWGGLICGSRAKDVRSSRRIQRIKGGDDAEGAGEGALRKGKLSSTHCPAKKLKGGARIRKELYKSSNRAGGGKTSRGGMGRTLSSFQS